MSAPLRRGQALQKSRGVVSSRSPIYSLADILEEIKGEKSVIENWIKQKAAGSPAPHFIGVGQALQKSKGVLSGRLANSINKNSKQFKFTKKTGKKTMENIM